MLCREALLGVQRITQMYRAAGAVLGRYRNLPIGIVITLIIAPRSLAVVIFETLVNGQIRFFSNFQGHRTIAKIDLTVRGRLIVCFCFEGQFAVERIADAAQVCKVHVNGSICLDRIFAHRFIVVACIHDGVCDSLFQLQAVWQLVSNRIVVVRKSALR